MQNIFSQLARLTHVHVRNIPFPVPGYTPYQDDLYNMSSTERIKAAIDGIVSNCERCIVVGLGLRPITLGQIEYGVDANGTEVYWVRDIPERRIQDHQLRAFLLNGESVRDPPSQEPFYFREFDC